MARLAAELSDSRSLTRAFKPAYLCLSRRAPGLGGLPRLVGLRLLGHSLCARLLQIGPRLAESAPQLGVVGLEFVELATRLLARLLKVSLRLGKGVA